MPSPHPDRHPVHQRVGTSPQVAAAGSHRESLAGAAGVSASLPHTRNGTCRSLAHEIWDQLGGRIDGLTAPSTVNGAATVILVDVLTFQRKKRHRADQALKDSTVSHQRRREGHGLTLAVLLSSRD